MTSIFGKLLISVAGALRRWSLLSGLPNIGRHRGTAIGRINRRGIRFRRAWLGPLLLYAVGVWGNAAATPVHDAQAWEDFDRLILQSQKAMMADPSAALEDARTAEVIAARHPSSPRHGEALATGLWLEAEALARINRIGEARAALNKASAFAAADGKLTKLDGDLALSRARIADSGGDFPLALKSYQKAHATFVQLGIPRSQAMALLGLGTIYEKAHDYGREIRYYREAAQVYSGDPSFALSVANNIGLALQQVGRYDDANRDYRRALEIATEIKSPMLEARILTNLAMSFAKQHKLADAQKAADKALRLLGPHDESGWAPFVWGVKADIEYQRGTLKLAVDDLNNAFRGVDVTTTIAPFRDIHEIAYKVYRAEGNFPLAVAHLEAFKRLDDEGRSLAASANLALVGAQFDFATQQLEIAHLKSAQLERDIALRKSRAAIQSGIFAAVGLAGLVLIAWIMWRHALMHRHRNAIGQKNVALTQTLAERDVEIVRRTEVETQLRLAMETAQQASRAKSHFLANMSHELRTPLNAIIGFSEFMVGRAIKPEKVQEYAANIAGGGRHLLSILNDILDMARIESGKVSLDESMIRLRDVIDHTISVLGSDTSSDRTKVKVADANLGVCVRADELRLQQVLVNLVSNAVKFTREDGSVEIRIECAEDGIDLVVWDNGEGIPADKLSVVMEPFGQVESAYARYHGGAGLGLPIVKSLIELHGGRFTITSDIHQGTLARVHLPMERVLTEDAAAAKDVSRPFTGTAA